MEEWRDVPGFPGYSASDAGNVRRDGSPVRTYLAKGYLMVSLKDDNGRRWSKGVHALVMLAFDGPPPPRHVVNHRDTYKLNNSRANLEYCTSHANMAHYMEIRLGRMKRGDSANSDGYDPRKRPKCAACAGRIYDSYGPRFISGRWRKVCDACCKLIPHVVPA